MDILRYHLIEDVTPPRVGASLEVVVDPCLVSGCNGLEHPKNIRISISSTNAQVDRPGLQILLIKIGARGIRKAVVKMNIQHTRGIFLANKNLSELDIFVLDFMDILEAYANYIIVSGYGTYCLAGQEAPRISI